MRFRLLASLLLVAVLAGLVYITDADTAPAGPSSISAPAGLSADDKAMKSLKID